MKKQSYRFLGVRVNSLTLDELNSLIAKAIQERTKWIIANHNLNSLYLYHHDQKMRAFYNKAKYVHIDGMSLILLGKLLRLPLKRDHRVTYADWVWSLMAKAAKHKWRIFYLGSKPGVAAKGAQILQQKFTGLNIATANGYFDISVGSPENQTILTKINTYQPHIVMVGMGMPLQESWILNNFEQIDANIILPSGACMDYVAGVVSTPPRWMGKIGFEWLYRLKTEPRRLWRRYLLESWFIVKLFFQELWSLYLPAR